MECDHFDDLHVTERIILKTEQNLSLVTTDSSGAILMTINF
jgi:hypothetical protein